MSRKKDVSLQIETFLRGEDIEFQIHSKREMQFILEDIAEKGTRVVLYYDGPAEFLLTTLLGANEQGVWLDVSPHPPENKRILRSAQLTAVSLHQGVKVQFAANSIQQALVGDEDAFYLPLPDYLLRLQRRDYFRLSIPLSTPLKCIIPVRPENPEEPDLPAIIREVPVMDISGGGVALICEEQEAELRPGRTYHDCRISLPNIGTLTVTLEIRNQSSFTNPNGTVSKRIGCQFVRMDNQAHPMLQHYINRLQSEALVRPGP
jgi:c-di-GMP-binding flagellar brake protein YcgR